MRGVGIHWRTIGLSIALLALAGRPAQAGQYHSGSSLVCSDCHAMHYSVSHDYSGGGGPSMGVSGPYEYMLKETRANICLFCHDGATGAGDIAPDVVGAAGAGQASSRQAGTLPTGSAPYADANGHSLNSTATAPGGTWSAPTGLACPDCHNAHGSANYRNLLLRPGGVGADRTVTSNSGAKNNAFAATESALTPTSTQYAESNVLFNEPSGTASAYANWCAACHTNFYGAGASAQTGGLSGGDPGTSPWIRHPQCDVNIGANSSLNSSLTHWSSALSSRVKTMSADAVYGNADDTPSCFSCHKAHGWTNKFSLIYDKDTTAATEDGPCGGAGACMLDTCQQCHYQ